MKRLDKYLVEERCFENRNRANDVIKAKKVKVDGKAAKASAKIDENSVVYGEEAGSKLTKAEGLGVATLTEEEMRGMD